MTQGKTTTTILALLLLVVACGHPISTDRAQCSEMVGVEAQSAGTWKELSDYFSRYGSCASQDAAVEEGFAAAAQSLLVNQWQAVGDVSALDRQVPGFQKFVIEHIDTTASAEQLAQIRDSADRSCPSQAASSLCAQIVNEAKSALNELKEAP